MRLPTGRILTFPPTTDQTAPLLEGLMPSSSINGLVQPSATRPTIPTKSGQGGLSVSEGKVILELLLSLYSRLQSALDGGSMELSKPNVTSFFSPDGSHLFDLMVSQQNQTMTVQLSFMDQELLAAISGSTGQPESR